jgi:hypothetical protein
MIKEHADHHDAELVLKLYDLRRETVMRQSRNAIAQFMPKTWEEFIAITQANHPMNAAWRQTSSYWEMAYGFARHGVVNPDFLIENTGEGLFLYAKVLPFLARFRKEMSSPTAFQNAEWITTQCATGKARLEMVQSRLRKMLESK